MKSNFETSLSKNLEKKLKMWYIFKYTETNLPTINIAGWLVENINLY